MSLTISPAQIVEESDSPLLAAPETWPRRPLGEVADILNGFAFKSKQFTQNGGMPLIRIRDIANDRTVVGFEGKYDSRYIIHPGELLVGMDGDFNCARWRGPESLLNQRVCRITPRPEFLDIGFLAFVLPGYLQAIHDATSSLTVTHLSSRDIALIPIPVPSLTEQKRLAEVFAACARTTQSANTYLATAQNTLGRFRRTVLSAACTGRLTITWRETHQPATVRLAAKQATAKRRKRVSTEPIDFGMPELPESYIVVTLGEVSELIEYGTSQKTDASDGIPVLRMGNIQDGRLDVTDLKYHVFDKEIEKLLLRDGDLLFNRTNSPELVGKSAVYHGTQPISFASYLIRVRLSADVCDPDFINYWINSAWGRAWAYLAKTDGVSQSNINSTKLAAMPIPLPSLEEQKEIVRRASHLLSTADALLTRIAGARRAINRTNQAILAKAFRSELIASTASEPLWHLGASGLVGSAKSGVAGTGLRHSPPRGGLTGKVSVFKHLVL